jgi:S-adenosylmethionine:tRNA ribosyltransferase-isomerase
VSSTSTYQTKGYHFDLPEELIASVPLHQRESSRLLVYHRSQDRIQHARISELPEILDASFTLVANNTKVIRARLLGERVGTGGKVEFFLLKKMNHTLKPTWKGLMKTGSKVLPGFQFVVQGIEGKVLDREDTTAGAVFTAEFSKDPVENGIGEVPLPPYIQQKIMDAMSGPKPDFSSQKILDEYNTLFAREEGSVASPTAGRHFTPELIQKLSDRGIGWNEITLHVGIGTFKPVTASDLRDHHMHAEEASISVEVSNALNTAKKSGKKILSIGTTSTRTLEGFSDASGKLGSGTRELDIYIYPGSSHRWKFVDAMLTNFHLPESTLLMMIASFIGSRERTLDLYQEAIRNRYRFYSYGDAMLIL